MSAETDIAAINDGGVNTASEVRTAFTSVLARADTWVFLDSSELTSDTASVTFSSIPGNCIELRILGAARTDRSGGTNDNLGLQVGNGSIDTGSNYDWRWRRAPSNTAADFGAGASDTQIPSGTDYGILPAATADANVFGSFEVRFNGYADTDKYKSILIEGGVMPTGTVDSYGTFNAIWRSTSAINTIKLFPVGGNNFVSGTNFYLYGIGT